jgi:hypothetical protein
MIAGATLLGYCPEARAVEDSQIESYVVQDNVGLQDSENLREEWKQILLHDLFQQRMLGKGFPVHSGWEDASFKELGEEALREWVGELKEIRSSLYSEEELQCVKEQLRGRLEEYTAFPHKVDRLLWAAFCLDVENEEPSFSAFVEQSYAAIVGWELPQLREEICDFLDVECRFASNWGSQGDFMEIPVSGFIWGESEPVAPISFVNEELGIDPFYTLPLTDVEMRQIAYIITTLAEKNIFELAFKKRDMEKRGKKINHVHPLRFMGYILSTSHLRKCAREIEKSSFKWDAFVGGFSKRMREEHAKGNVMPYIHGFSDLLGAPTEQVSHYVHKRNFEGMVRHLM